MKSQIKPAYKKVAGDVLLSICPDALTDPAYMQRRDAIAEQIEQAVAADGVQAVSDPDKSLRERLGLTHDVIPLVWWLRWPARVLYWVCVLLVAVPGIIIIILQNSPITPGEKEGEMVDRAERKN